MESHVHCNNNKIAVIKLKSSNMFPSHCSKLEAYLSSMNYCSSHHPPGITVKIVGIESGTNGRSCYQYEEICGSLVEEDVVHMLRKLQISRNSSLGQEETAIAVFHVTDGIDQCHVVSCPVILCLALHHLMVFWYR